MARRKPKPPEQTITDEALFQGLAKKSYEFYLEYVHRGIYRHAAHTRLIANRLQRIADGESIQLMIFAPPRHSKSMTVTDTFPSYFIGKGPNRRVITVSYGDSLAHRFGRSNRQILQEYGKQLFGVSLAPDNSSVTNWSLRGHPGGMLSAGIGGPITGEGAHLLVIDDPIKNRSEALSSTYREMVWREWQNTLLTRLASKASVILTLTRWHQDDLPGRILADVATAGQWEVIVLPCEAEEGDLLGRQIGEPLWPEMGFDKAWMEQLKLKVGSMVWTALYQQHPSSAEGTIFKREWWRYYHQAPAEFDEIIHSWDMTFKETTSGSFVVDEVWGRRGADKFLLDLFRDRIDFTETLKVVKSMAAKWPKGRAKLVEDKANGSAVISTLKREIPGLIAVEPQGSKESRAAAVSPQVEAGNVYLPDPSIAPWVHDFIEECAAFPTGATDDQVDALSQALLRFESAGQPYDATTRKLLQGVSMYG